MLKRTLTILALTLTQAGCYFDFGDRYQVADLPPEARAEAERKKRELIQIEDIVVGNGPVAAWGRKISADVEIRSADFTLYYRGNTWTYYGFKNMPEINISDAGHLSIDQQGIRIGLNGMAVGGKRRMTIDPELVCIRNNSNQRTICPAVGRSEVRKEKLVIEATLTASCTPV